MGSYALKQRQYSNTNDSSLTEPLKTAFEFLRKVVLVVPPRTNNLKAGGSTPLTAYSDAEFTPGIPPRLGWIIFDQYGVVQAAATLLLDERIPSLWKPRQTQIFPAESLAPSVAIALHRDILQGRDVRWFVDNEAACSTLIRGASKEEDVNGIAECTQILAMRLELRIWYEWVDSKANCSDGLSRLGLNCPDYGPQAITAPQPPWQLLPCFANRLQFVAEKSLHLIAGV